MWLPVLFHTRSFAQPCNILQWPYNRFRVTYQFTIRLEIDCVMDAIHYI